MRLDWGGTMYKNQILFYSLYNKAFAVLEMHLFHHRDKHHVKPTTVPCRNIIMTEVLAKCTETTTITTGLLMRSQSRTIGGICFVVIFQQEGCIIPTLRHHHNKETRIHGPLHETLNPPHPPPPRLFLLLTRPPSSPHWDGKHRAQRCLRL